MSLDELTSAFSFEGVNRSNAVVNFSDADPIDPKALWLNAQHLRSMPVEKLAAAGEEDARRSPPAAVWRRSVSSQRSSIPSVRASPRCSTFPLKGRAYFADDFPIEAQALAKLDVPGARELLHELADRLEANPEFSEASVESDLRKLAEERGVKAGVLINASRAALTGQSVGPSAFAVFACIGRERTLARLRKV